MIVTSLSALAVSVRSTLARGRSNTATTSSSAASATPVPAPADSVELSTQAVTLVKALDADGDGLVPKDELSEGAIELLKRASIRFHHQRVAAGQVTEKRDPRSGTLGRRAGLQPRRQ